VAILRSTLSPRLPGRAALPDPAPDAALLSRFVDAGDEAAFAAIVERHGPVVLGVCRRVLGDPHAAEDAFQSVFYALARGAGRVRTAGALAAWLYGAAVRVALRTRRSRDRAGRAAARATARRAADPLAEVTGRELVAAVDEELARLPETYRAAVVLCCLDGLSQDEAARRLGCSPGALRGRLARGRERLRAQLARRGVALAAGLGAVLVGDAAPAVPPALFALVVERGGTGPASPVVAGLAAAVFPAGWTPRLAAIVALALAAAGGVTAVGGETGSEPAPPVEPKPGAKAEPDPEGRVDRFGDPLPAGAVLRLGTTRLRHPAIFSIAFTPDGKLVSFGRDYAVRVWDPAFGRLLRERAFEKDPLHRNEWGGCLSPDARRLAVQRLDRIKVFDVDSGAELASVALPDTFEALARFSRDGKLLAVADRSTIRLCELASGTSRTLAKTNEVGWGDFAFSPDGKRLALATPRSGVIVWDTASGRETLPATWVGSNSCKVDFDASGTAVTVLRHPSGQFLEFLDVTTGRTPDGWKSPTLDDQVDAVFAPDGKTIVLAGPGGVQWYDPKAGQIVRQAPGLVRWLARPVFSPDGRLLAAASENRLLLWDATTAKSALPPGGSDGMAEEVRGVAVSPDGRWFVTNEVSTGTIRVWDAGGRPRGEVRTNGWAGRYPVFSPDGRHLFGAAPDAPALVRWDLPGGTESARYSFPESARGLSEYNFRLSADGSRLAAVWHLSRMAGGGLGGGTPVDWKPLVTVWDAATAKQLTKHQVTAPGDFFGYYGAISPELRWCTAGGRMTPLTGGGSYRFDLPKQWLVRQSAISADGRLVALSGFDEIRDGGGNTVGSDYGTFVVEAATGKPVLTMPADGFGPLAFTPDGAGLVTTGPGGITRWSLATRKPVVRHKSLGRYTGNYGLSFASSLAVTADGTKAVTGHIDTTALVWDLRGPDEPKGALSEKELAAAWDDLAGADAGRAYAAVWAMAGAGDAAVAYLRTRVRPVEPAREEDVHGLVGRLNAAAFADREAAEKALRDLGERAEPALRAMLPTTLTPEQRTRVERLLAAVTPGAFLLAGDRLRGVRAVAVLERVGTPAARDVLARLAGGAADARLTREAGAAAERLGRKGDHPPKPPRGDDDPSHQLPRHGRSVGSGHDLLGTRAGYPVKFPARRPAICRPRPGPSASARNGSPTPAGSSGSWCGPPRTRPGRAG